MAQRSRRRIPGWTAPGLAAILLLTACSTPGASGGQSPSNAGRTGRAALSSGNTSPKPDAAAPAVITTSGTDTPIDPVTPVTVTVTDGTLLAVSMVNPEGTAVAGALAADGASWTTTEVLGYGRTYTVTATAVNANGVHTQTTSTVATVKPANLTMPYLQRTGGYPLTSGAIYGVGIVPVVHFDEHIADEKTAEQSLVVTTTPHVDGSWYWVDDQNVHWRPENFYAAGTQVTVSANVYGKQLGPGLYGQSDVSVSFTIGDKHVAIADDTTHQVSVYFNDQLVRTMPTSMGQGGWVQGTNGKISLWTMPGTYTVLEHDNPVSMSSDSYGLPANSPYGYPAELIYWATKISTDGIYLHQLDSTVWAQGHRDLSHGCLNLNRDNATWYFQNSQIGDVVEVVNTGGPGIQVWQNGDWSVPWATWVAGSALH